MFLKSIKLKCLACSLALAGILSSGSALAVPVSFGALSSNDDGSTNIVYDSLNNVQWMRMDALYRMSLVDIQTEIKVGGSLYGWHLSGIEEMYNFIDALQLGLSVRGSSGSGSFGHDLTELGSVIGLNHISSADLLDGAYFFENKLDPELKTGGYVYFVDYLSNQRNSGDYVEFNPGPLTWEQGQELARQGNFNGGVFVEAGALLYRVPEPSTLSLLGFALACIFLTRQKCFKANL